LVFKTKFLEFTHVQFFTLAGITGFIGRCHYFLYLNKKLKLKKAQGLAQIAEKQSSLVVTNRCAL
jgi:hypothetical protein